MVKGELMGERVTRERGVGVFAGGLVATSKGMAGAWVAGAEAFYLELFKKDFQSVGARNKSPRLGYRFIEVRGIIFWGSGGVSVCVCVCM